MIQIQNDSLVLCYFRLAKAEDDHQVAIAEKLDLEARLNEELEMTKVLNSTCFNNDQPGIFICTGAPACKAHQQSTRCKQFW